jgi:hypothetical protein
MIHRALGPGETASERSDNSSCPNLRKIFTSCPKIKLGPVEARMFLKGAGYRLLHSATSTLNPSEQQFFCG